MLQSSLQQLLAWFKGFVCSCSKNLSEQLLNISPSKYVCVLYITEFLNINIWFTSDNSQPFVTEDSLAITW